MKTLGERLQAARSHARLSQKELEDKTGVSQKTISKLERGAQTSTTKIVELARACGVRSEWLANGLGPMIEQPLGVAETRATYGELLSTDGLELARIWQELPEDRRNHFRGRILLEGLLVDTIGGRALVPRPTESGRDFQRRVLRALRAKKNGEP